MEFYGSFVLKEAIGGLYKISGTAIHPVKTHHPREWVKLRQYVEPYLEQAAPSLTKVPVTIDHGNYPHTIPLTDCRITVSSWKDGQLIYEGLVNARVADLIRQGKIKGVSLGIDWLKPGGGILVGAEGQVIPFSFEFNEFSLIQNMQPGDPTTTVRLWEALTEGIRSGDFSDVEKQRQAAELLDIVAETTREMFPPVVQEAVEAVKAKMQEEWKAEALREGNLTLKKEIEAIMPSGLTLVYWNNSAKTFLQELKQVLESYQ
jgi:hypothetical protein